MFLLLSLLTINAPVIEKEEILTFNDFIKSPWIINNYFYIFMKDGNYNAYHIDDDIRKETTTIYKGYWYTRENILYLKEYTDKEEEAWMLLIDLKKHQEKDKYKRLYFRFNEKWAGNFFDKTVEFDYISIKKVIIK